MANKLKSMLQIKRILQLLIKDKTPGFISKELCISVNTVKKYRRKFKQSGLSYCELFSSSQEKLESLVYPSKDKTQKSLRQVVLSELIPDYVKRLQNTHITRELLWKEYIFKHSEGYSYSQFCEHISRYMLQAKAVMHLEHKAGDTLQIDFAGSKLSYIDKSNGKKILCPVLVCVLPFSSFCYVEALANMSQLELIGSLNRCLTYFGGVAHNICSDNLKQVVNKPDKYEPKFSDLMDQFALHYNLSLTATRVLKPRDKASVERHVGIAYSRIYAVLEQQQYYSLSELNAALKELLNEFNDAPMQRKNHTRRECFVKYELPFLLPLPDQPFEIKYQTGAKVQTNYHVILGHDWHNYSVPYQLIGKQVKLIYDSEHVEIYHRHKRIAFHKRDYTKNGFTTCDEHRPDNHKIASLIQQYKPEDFMEKASLVGDATYKLIGKIIDNKFFSGQIFKSCLGILRLGDIYGNDRLEKACELALTGSVLNYRTVKNIIDNKRDKCIEAQTEQSVTDKEHSNIRGSNFFAEIDFN